MVCTRNERYARPIKVTKKETLARQAVAKDEKNAIDKEIVK
jgi:hypothetical protein